MRGSVLDAELVRHDTVKCDRCGAEWTVDVCERNGWRLAENAGDGDDICNRCLPAPRVKKGKR